MKNTGNLKPSIILTSRIYPLQIPLTLSDDEKWKPFPLFKGITGGLREISCHASVLAKKNSPHALHAHEEEELVLLLSGSLNLKLPDTQSPIKNQNVDLKKGQFVYFPSGGLYVNEIHEFNFRIGTNINNRENIDSNSFLEVLKKYWGLNSLKPSNVTFISNDRG